MTLTAMRKFMASRDADGLDKVSSASNQTNKFVLFPKSNFVVLVPESRQFMPPEATAIGSHGPEFNVCIVGNDLFRDKRTCP